MCGRYSYWDSNTIVSAYDCVSSFDIPSNYNVSPSSYIPVITQTRQTIAADEPLSIDTSPFTVRSLQAMRWGLVPSWAKADSHKGYSNARSETIATKPSFKENFFMRRCVVPASGFYEWDGDKQPYFISLVSKHMAFAGVWDKGSSGIDPSVAIITRASIKLQFLHERVPVVLAQKADIDTWLNPRATAQELHALLNKSSDAHFLAYKVDKRVNNPRNNDAGLAKPLV